jgi:hypothetical protein
MVNGDDGGEERSRILSTMLDSTVVGPTSSATITSLPESRDCPRPETLSLLESSHIHLRSYKHINHLLLSSRSLSTRRSIRDDLMCSIDRTIDRFVAAVHICPNFSPYAETTECAGEVKTRCARFAAASGTP